MKKLLIVDDDEVFCDALARAMDRRGFEVYKTYTAQSAISQAKEHQPAFALVDLRIGQDSGLHVVQQLVESVSGIRVVVLTGYASIATAVEAIKLGAIQYLTKPTEPDLISAAFFQLKGNPEATPPENPMSVERLEWEHIQKVLTEHEGNISAAARSLGMHRRTLQRKLSKKPRKR